MGLKTPSSVPKQQIQTGNNNILVRTAMTQNNRKRSIHVTSSGTKHNNGRGQLSQATLQRIFIIMMGIVFCLYFFITIYLIQQQESNTTAFETEGGKQGPATINYNKNEILREHIANLKSRKSHTNNNDNVKAVLKHRQQQQNSSTSNESNKLNHRKEPTSSKFDLEEVDIHGMKHPKTIKRGKDSVISSDSTPTHSSSKTLKAYLEPVYLQDYLIKPLPVRNITKDLLTVIEYSRVNSCQRLPELLPVDDYPDGDSFLPWIHDVFPTDDGRFIQFVAQNKRRCQSGTTPDQLDILEKMQPQLSLLQHVPIKRIKIMKENLQQQSEDEEIRYKLTSHKEADPDGIETRFICKFSDNQETLSRFNFNYDYAAKRKHNKHLFTKDGHKDNKSIHTSQLIFMCPVPKSLIEIVRDGTSVIDDYATLFVSLIPIRTPPRYGNPDQFLPPRYQDKGKTPQTNFNASVEWGEVHILPRIEDSGRWENIPVCLPTWKAYPTITSPPLPKEKMFEQPEVLVRVSSLNSTINTKKHRVVATTWASSSYSTRGDRFAIDDGARRLDEWIRFHLMVGIDHIFIYDNSQGEYSLIDVTTQFPNKVTRIRWPASVCNNNRSFHDNPGERSSQYAAESSGRLRFGPHTDWMANFDIDEYITPVGIYSLKAFLTNLDNHNTKIVSFGSWRAWPRRDLIEDPIPIQNKTICDQPHPCFELKVPNNYSILQTYNCDRQLVKTKKMPAEKQIYRTDYVLQHFVHFSTVTTYTMMNMKEAIAAGMNFGIVSPDPFSRFADEQTEVTMLHAKAMATQDTAGWQKRCKGELKGECRIGVPHPDLNASSTVMKDNLGWLYNCFVNPKIEDYLIPLLNEEMKKSKIVNFTRT